MTGDCTANSERFKDRWFQRVLRNASSETIDGRPLGGRIRILVSPANIYIERYIGLSPGHLVSCRSTGIVPADQELHAGQ